MSTPISDKELTNWAREHLVYEARMLAYSAIELAKRKDDPRDAASNVLVESFALHVRCLGDFFWGNRSPRHQEDAFAYDFCAPGVWQFERGKWPTALAAVRQQDRAGREVVHLTYHRLRVQPEAKDWLVSDLLFEIEDALHALSIRALPERMDDQTRTALQDPATHSGDVGPPSVATGLRYSGGTVAFPHFVAGS